jgi:hypothetical protein
MSEKNAVIAIYDTRAEAERAVKALRGLGFDLHLLGHVPGLEVWECQQRRPLSRSGRPRRAPRRSPDRSARPESLAGPA